MSTKRPSTGAKQARTPSLRSVRRRVLGTGPSPTAFCHLRHIPPGSPEWTDPRTTCLIVGLDPSGVIHHSVTCDKCKLFWEQKLCCDVVNMVNEEGSGRRMMYERPFDCSDAKKNPKYNYKLQTRDKLRSLFAATGLVDSPATEHFVTPSSRGVRNTLEHPSGSVNKPTSNNRGATKSFNDNGSLTVDLIDE